MRRREFITLIGDVVRPCNSHPIIILRNWTSVAFDTKSTIRAWQISRYIAPARQVLLAS